MYVQLFYVNYEFDPLQIKCKRKIIWKGGGKTGIKETKLAMSWISFYIVFSISLFCGYSY